MLQPIAMPLQLDVSCASALPNGSVLRWSMGGVMHWGPVFEKKRIALPSLSLEALTCTCNMYVCLPPPTHTAHKQIMQTVRTQVYRCANNCARNMPCWTTWNTCKRQDMLYADVRPGLGCDGSNHHIVQNARHTIKYVLNM